LFFSGTTLLLTWWCAHRALAPVRELEASLHRLARGEPDPALPAFALREFGRVARAIEHLAGALRDARDGQHALARRLIAVQEDERRALARELHDEMGQTLTALNVTAAHLVRNAGRIAPADVAECAGELRRELRTCAEQLRTILKSLRPHGLDAGGLGPTLRELVEGWRGRCTGLESGIAFALELPARLPDIGEAQALALYRVVQEALTNVVRHSGARHCVVRIAADVADATALVLEVGDDGCGLPAGVRRGGGLLGMQERAGMAGGELRILPNPAGGLLLRARFPLAGAAGDSRSATEGVEA
jgi:two-component system sensor histidine kinase UhpB